MSAGSAAAAVAVADAAAAALAVEVGVAEAVAAGCADSPGLAATAADEAAGAAVTDAEGGAEADDSGAAEAPVDAVCAATGAADAVEVAECVSAAMGWPVAELPSPQAALNPSAEMHTGSSVGRTKTMRLCRARRKPTMTGKVSRPRRGLR